MNTKTLLPVAFLLTIFFSPTFGQNWSGNYAAQSIASQASYAGPQTDFAPQNSVGYLPAYLPEQAPGVVSATYCDVGCDDGIGVGSCDVDGGCGLGGMCGLGDTCGLGGGCGAGGLGGNLLGLMGGGLAGGGVASGGGWLDLEYLLWWNKERYIPALATRSPANTPLNVAGQLGQPTTQLIYGDSLIGGGPYSGVRVSTGRWLDAQQTLGIGGRFFYVGGSEDWDRSSDGDPILARPVFDTDIGAPSSLLIAAPGQSTGSISVTAENSVTGFDIFLRKLMLSGYCNRLDFIGGFHNSTIEDQIDVVNTIVNEDINRAPIGTRVRTRDTFEVTNSFNGGFVGLMGTAADGPLSWNMLAKVAFGNMNQEANIRGGTISNVPGANSSTNPIGFLALPTNIGTFDRDEFAIVPEINVTMGYNVTRNFQVTLGYTFIYWSKVALAGDMIDTSINSTQLAGTLVGEARPTARLTSDGFWYSGLNIGGAVRF